jgi:putative transposase
LNLHTHLKIVQIAVKRLSKLSVPGLHECPHCGYVADRDENAAKNILKSALKQLANTVGQTEINASRETDLCLRGETQPL